MTSLSDRLKSLGVKVGAQDLAPQPQARPAGPLEQILSGHPLQTPQGETFVSETFYPADYCQGSVPILTAAPLAYLARWAGEEKICSQSIHSFAYLDIETTGLSGGTGTYAFLVGIGRFENEHFRLAQFFMRDPLEEPAQLAALEEFLAPCSTLVTFNGKAFDIPLLSTRYITHGWQTPFEGASHVDLLHLARRLWRDRLPSRTLGNLEVQILGTERSQEDIPGWMIPSMYFDYLRSGDAQPLKKVFYHNAMDIVSLAALFNHMASLLANPFDQPLEHGLDIVALARLFESMGEIELATRLYIYGLEQDLPKDALLDALMRLALIYKRRDDLEAAMALWRQAGRFQHLDAYIELAKACEHRLRDYAQAIRWTRTAIESLQSGALPLYEQRQWMVDLEHRLLRLEKKIK